MKKLVKWAIVTSILIVPLLAASAWTLQNWIGAPDFKLWFEEDASKVLGVPVKLERIEVAIWPLPALAVSGIKIQTHTELTLERFEIRPAWHTLLLGKFELATVLVRGAVLPQAGINELLSALQKRRLSTPVTSEKKGVIKQNFQYIPHRTVLDNVSWVSTRGVVTVLNADASLDEWGLPEQVSIKALKGPWHGATASLRRRGNDWTLSMEVGGGKVTGEFQLQTAAEGASAFSLKGQLQTKAVEVATLTTAAQAVLTGKLDAQTSLSVHAASVGALVESLQTQSQFTVGNAVLHGIDLVKAVKTVGLSRGGETALDTLGGQVTTHGRAVQLSNLAASSGVLSANGSAAVAPSRVLTGRINVNLVATALGGAVGVPLVLGGTLDSPEVTLTHGALIGAAIGTAVMPGVGTGAGARLGDKIGSGLTKLFKQ